VTFGYQADVDESGTCAPGLAGAICRLNVDSIAPAGFIARGGVDVSFRVESILNLAPATFDYSGSGRCWGTQLVSILRQSRMLYDGWPLKGASPSKAGRTPEQFRVEQALDVSGCA